MITNEPTTLCLGYTTKVQQIKGEKRLYSLLFDMKDQECVLASVQVRLEFMETSLHYDAGFALSLSLSSSVSIHKLHEALSKLTRRK